MTEKWGTMWTPARNPGFNCNEQRAYEVMFLSNIFLSFRNILDVVSGP